MILAYTMENGITVIGVDMRDEQKMRLIIDSRAWLHDHLGDPVTTPQDPVSMMVFQMAHHDRGWAPCTLDTSFFLHLGYAFALVFGKADMVKFLMFHDVEWFERRLHF